MHALVPFLSGTSLFADLPESCLEQAAQSMEIHYVQKGETLLGPAKIEDCIYVILEGRLALDAAAQPTTRVTEVAPGQCVGEWSALSGSSRPFNVLVIEDSRLARLSRTALQSLVERFPEATELMRRRVLESFRKVQISIALRQSTLFGMLPESVLSALDAEFESVMLAGGETLFHRGETGDALYFVVSGRLYASAERESGEVVVAEIKQGETAGEMALFSREHRTATVRAARDSHLAKLSAAGFERLLVRYPLEMVPLFTRDLVARIGRQNTATSVGASEIRAIAVIACGPEVPLADFCARLTQALGRVALALHLSSRIVDSHLGGEGISQTAPGDGNDSRMVEWLANQEIRYRYLVYEADAAGTPWTWRAVRQADHLLFVGVADGDPQPGEVESRILQQSAAGRPARLVLLHSTPGRLPSGTARWLQPRRAQGHYHVRSYSDADFDRVARSLAGCGIGVVLGGGFARGLAHIGLIRVLRDVRVPIDFIGGTSMGAIIGAQCAAEFEPERITEIMLRHSPEAMRDYTLPVLSLFTGRRIAEIIRVVSESAGVHQIEDAWLPFFCVSTNLSRAEMMVHTAGPAVTSLLASSRVPGLFPPITAADQVLVDGGLVNNVPVDVMRRFMSNGGTVIASDVAPRVDFLASEDFGIGVSGWRLLWRRLTRIAPHSRSLGMREVLMRSIEFGAAFHLKRMKDLADLYLNMPLEQFKSGDFHRGREIIDAGYRFSRVQLESWLARSDRPPAELSRDSAAGAG